VTEWPTLFLAAIAAATGVMALIQVCALIYGARLARRVNRLADRVEREIDPFMGKVQDISSDATRVTKLAVAQVERADQLMAQLARRVEATLDVAQDVLIAPARRGLALIEGLRAMFSSVRKPGKPRSDDTKSTEEDEALFIG
jgi:hypothetical protein